METGMFNMTQLTLQPVLGKEALVREHVLQGIFPLPPRSGTPSSRHAAPPAVTRHVNRRTSTTVMFKEMSPLGDFGDICTKLHKQ